MAASVKQVIPDVKSFHFIFESGEFRGKPFTASLAANCLNSLCACEDAKVIAQDQESGEEYIFYITKDRSLSSKHSKSMTKEAKILGKSFSKEIDEDTWNEFLQFIYSRNMLRQTSLRTSIPLRLIFPGKSLR